MAKCAICEKGVHYEIMSAILIEDQIMFGSQTLRRFLARSMEFHRSYMYVLHV